MRMQQIGRNRRCDIPRLHLALEIVKLTTLALSVITSVISTMKFFVFVAVRSLKSLSLGPK